MENWEKHLEAVMRLNGGLAETWSEARCAEGVGGTEVYAHGIGDGSLHL